VAPPTASDPATPTVVRAPRWVTPLVILAALALFAGGALAGWAVSERGTDPETASEAASEPAMPPATFVTSDGGGPGLVPSNVEEPVAAVARAVGPSVVQIDTDFGLGSGIIMDAEGHILTAAHVISGATQIRVRLADGTMVPARLVGTHPETDVGVVSIDPRPDLVPAVLGVDAEIQVGQLAVAVGSPFGLEQTVTSGIVSALDRPVQTEGSLLVGMIQTDASINPGNSGGALADRHGRVIGINDAIRTQGGGNEGVGFAIPIDLAASVAERLIAGESIQSGFLGVSVQNPMEGRSGALVQEVTVGTPADDAGIEIGDLIVAIDGQSVRSREELRARVLAISPGTPVVVEVVRNAESIKLEVVLAVNQT
jgi:putative serine protease PepD